MADRTQSRGEVLVPCHVLDRPKDGSTWRTQRAPESNTHGITGRSMGLSDTDTEVGEWWSLLHFGEVGENSDLCSVLQIDDEHGRCSGVELFVGEEGREP